MSSDWHPGPASDELEDETGNGGQETRRRRWFGRRRRAESRPEPPDGADAGPAPEPDWNAVLDDAHARGPALDWWGDRAPAATEPTPKDIGWSEWAPPATDAEAEPAPAEAEAAEVAEAEAAPATSEAATEAKPDSPATEGPGSPPGEGVTVAVWETLGAQPAGSPQTEVGAAPAPAPAGGSDEGAAEPEGPPEEPRYRTTPSWPPPRKPRIGLGLLSLLVMVIMVALLVTNGRIESTSEPAEPSLDRLPALQVAPESVPKDWIVFRHPTAGFGISYPPSWTARDTGTGVEIRDPSARAQLQINHRRPPGATEPEDQWLEQERDFSGRRLGYRRLQLSEATYQGHLAALWEYTFAEGDGAIHAADLQFVTDRDRFVLNFRAPGGDWQSLLPTFQGFLSSFRAPS